jgi:hypothetical protein
VNIETRYSIGDVVFAPSTIRHLTHIPCAACAGIGRLKLNGAPFACGTCHGYGSFPGPTEHTPSTRRLTIGQVRVTVGGDEECRYMAKETGIGSGQLWDENDFFSTEAEAEIRAREMTHIGNTTDRAEWEKRRARELAIALAATRAEASSSPEPTASAESADEVAF